MKREDFLRHVGWTGAGLLWTVSSAGTLRAIASAAETGPLTFVQISDSHIGFHQAPNEDVTATLQKAIDAINALPVQPTFVMHTGDVSHLSKPDQFDTAKQLLGTLKAPFLTIPGEHDMLGDEGKGYLAAFQPRDRKDPWWSWDQSGVHFIALVNVFNFEKNGLLGREQIDWLAKDVPSVNRLPAARTRDGRRAGTAEGPARQVALHDRLPYDQPRRSRANRERSRPRLRVTNACEQAPRSSSNIRMKRNSSTTSWNASRAPSKRCMLVTAICSTPPRRAFYAYEPMRRTAFTTPSCASGKNRIRSARNADPYAPSSSSAFATRRSRACERPRDASGSRGRSGKKRKRSIFRTTSN